MENNFQEDIGKIIDAIEQLYNISIKKKQTMPTASLDYANQIVLYIGETDSNYVKNTFYRCERNGSNYVWTISNSSTEQAVEEALELTCLRTETTDTVIDDAITHNAIDYTIYGNTGGVGDEVTIEGATKYVIPVRVSGNNLFNAQKIVTDTNNYYNNQSAAEILNGRYLLARCGHRGIFINGNFKENTQYTISLDFSWYNGTPWIRYWAYYTDGSFADLGFLIKLTSDSGVTRVVATTSAGKTLDYIQGANYSAYTDQYLIDINTAQFVEGAYTVGTIPDYEPYRVPTITNIYLDAPISEGESASLSTTNTQIPLVKNSNIIEFETTVQPSNFKFKYYQDINKVLEKQKAELQALILSYHS